MISTKHFTFVWKDANGVGQFNVNMPHFHLFVTHYRTRKELKIKRNTQIQIYFSL